MRYSFLTGSYAGPNEAGVCRVSFDPDSGFHVERAATGYVNPSYVLPHPNGRVFYAVEETGAGAVHAGLMDDALSKQPGGLTTGGADPCHLALSRDLRFLYAANYSSGSLAAFALDPSGALMERTQLIQREGRGPNPARQERAHVHFSMQIDGTLYICDLGTDAVVLYRNEGGTLREVGRADMPPGSGPRHLAYHPRRPERLYCVAELGNCVYAMRRQGDALSIEQALSMLPGDYDGESTAAAIHMTPDGDLLLASNRGHDSIAVFPVLPDGRLGEPVISPCVAQPRDFAICGDHVLAASQRDSVIRAYRLDRASLRLEETGMSLFINRPVCLAAVE